MSNRVVIMNTAVPTDSVLRRHYEASKQTQSGKNASTQDSGGLFSWLKRLFGG